ncbi:SDR family oxidoreductase [Halobacillus yeomjeoni]|uniref:NAD(P)-dependent oxidoreductase n=1 Tax=Halobacillus yeomjeoni TaxID=311194 RepID=UPI001CD39466|nr:SDR family oxidoreductase [Halobacillus yeomjeoni]MCA0983914.1 SDR family oxidoreductase [Halobacillus yeomjeoni]
MKIAVFGATGRVGARVVNKAMSDGHEVKALVRDEDKAKDIIPGAELVTGDVKNREDIENTLKGCECVFSGLGTDKTDTLSTYIPMVIDLMNEHGIKRIVTIGTAGILNSRFEEGKFRFQSNESKRKLTFAAEEHLKVYQALNKSRLEWTIICPTYLPEGDSEGEVRYEINYLPEGGKKVTTEDTAEFAYQELIQKRFIHQRVGICY